MECVMVTTYGTCTTETCVHGMDLKPVPNLILQHLYIHGTIDKVPPPMFSFWFQHSVLDGLKVFMGIWPCSNGVLFMILGFQLFVFALIMAGCVFNKAMLDAADQGDVR